MALTTVLPPTLAEHFALPFSDWREAKLLAAGVAESFTVPTGADFVSFSANGDFYARADGTAAEPSGDVTDGTASELNPTIRKVTGVERISVIANAATIVVASFYL